MSTQIWVTFSHPGFHCWPDAPQHRAYLRAPHRHKFIVRVETAVLHDDRELEFHDLLDFAKGEFARGFTQEDAQGFDTSMARSCEHMAKELGSACVEKFARPFNISVSEDGECGAEVFIGVPAVTES